MSSKISVCIRQTGLPSANRLFTDFLYHFNRVSAFYPHPPQLEAAASLAKAIELDPRHREQLVTALREQNSGTAAAAHLDLLAKPGTVVVATGQQVGLYGGPVFTLYKALTALKLAEALREQGTPAVAVFWLATEDHDIAEVDHAWVFNQHLEPIKLQAEADPGPAEPVGGVPILDGASEGLKEALSGLPFGQQVEELARQAYPQDGDFQSGFVGLYSRLLEAYGLIFLDPMSSSLRQLAAPLFQRALSGAPELSRRLIERGEALEGAGYHAQVHVTEETSLVFLMEQGERVALRRSGSEYSSESATYSVDQLLHRLKQSPEDFSPNALLRPVTQDFLLPTAVYVGGPSELAYLAQAEVLYKELLGRMPVVVPRASFTILDPKAERLLERYGLKVSDCFDGADALRRKIAERLVPSTLERTLADAEGRIESALEDVRRELETFDPTLSSALTTTGKKILYQYGKIRGKAAQESLRRDERADHDARYLSDLIFPDRSLQQRLYSVLPFLAQHGFDFIPRVYDAIYPDCHDHQVWVPET